MFRFFPPCTVYLVVWRERRVEVKKTKERRGMVTPSIRLDVKVSNGKRSKYPSPLFEYLKN